MATAMEIDEGSRIVSLDKDAMQIDHPVKVRKSSSSSARIASFTGMVQTEMPTIDWDIDSVIKETLIIPTETIINKKPYVIPLGGGTGTQIIWTNTVATIVNQFLDFHQPAKERNVCIINTPLTLNFNDLSGIKSGHILMEKGDERKFLDEITKCFSNRNTDLAIVTIRIQITTGGSRFSKQKFSAHANALVINRRLEVIERFEPHGFAEWNEVVDNLIKKEVVPALPKPIKNYRYADTIGQMCLVGSKGPQVLSGDVEGFCSTFSVLFTHLRMLNPVASMGNIVSSMNQEKFNEPLIIKIKRYNYLLEKSFNPVRNDKILRGVSDLPSFEEHELDIKRKDPKIIEKITKASLTKTRYLARISEIAGTVFYDVTEPFIPGLSIAVIGQEHLSIATKPKWQQEVSNNHEVCFGVKGLPDSNSIYPNSGEFTEHVFIIINDEVLGHCMVITNGKIHEIWSVCIARKAQGKGLGTLLFDFIINKMIYQRQHVEVVRRQSSLLGRDKHTLWLTVDYDSSTFKQALALYTSMGFSKPKNVDRSLLWQGPNFNLGKQFLQLTYTYVSGVENRDDAMWVRHHLPVPSGERKKQDRKMAVDLQRKIGKTGRRVSSFL